MDMVYNMIKWGALLSQTGKELATICRDLGIKPNIVLSTKQYNETCSEFRELIEPEIFQYIALNESKNPYLLMKYLAGYDLVTCHGWLRIIPESVCSSLNIYNGHPGDIIQYPELKGFNPQQKAYDLKLSISGSVVHKVTEKVDDGPILHRVITSIKDCDLDTVYNRLRYTSLLAWKLFFTDHIKSCNKPKYAITGAHCTGKTTLVDAVRSADISNKYEYITSMTREAKQLGFRINEQGNDETQLYILNKHLERLVINKSCVLDRSLIDGYTYTKILHELGNISNTVMKYAKSLLSYEYMSRYNKIFYLPPTIQLVNDGLRSVQPEFRQHVINVFENIVQGASLFMPDLVSIIDGSVEQRVQAVDKHIKIKHEF